jgi:hypothetical protein
VVNLPTVPARCRLGEADVGVRIVDVEQPPPA